MDAKQQHEALLGLVTIAAAAEALATFATYGQGNVDEHRREISRNVDLVAAAVADCTLDASH